MGGFLSLIYGVAVYLFFNATFDRRYVMEVCDGLVPELQRRGLTRTRYAHKYLKDNLLEF